MTWIQFASSQWVLGNGSELERPTYVSGPQRYVLHILNVFQLSREGECVEEGEEQKQILRAAGASAISVFLSTVCRVTWLRW